MALTSEEKVDIIKQAYLDDYQGSFTDLFIQADPNSLADDPTMSPAIQPDINQMPTSAPLPPDPVTNPGVGDVSPISSAQGLVQSYESAPPTEIPRGQGITNTIDQAMSYKKGGYRVADMLNLDYKPTKPNAKEYIKNYLDTKYGYGGYYRK